MKLTKELIKVGNKFVPTKEAIDKGSFKEGTVYEVIGTTTDGFTWVSRRQSSGHLTCTGLVCSLFSDFAYENFEMQFIKGNQTTDVKAEDKVSATIAERGKVYGDPYDSHENIGLCWTALIQQHYGLTLAKPIPASLVAQMMVSFKMQRSAKVFHEDNYVDAHAYAKFAEEFQQRETSKKKETK